MTLRDRLISSGHIVPQYARQITMVRRPPVLRLDDRGRAAAAVHIAECQQNADLYAYREFSFNADEWMFGVSAEEECS